LAAVTGVPEAPLDRTENGLQAAGDGWFVVNARDAVWGESETMGVFTRLGESKAARFPQLGFNIGVLWPGQPACMYHREPNQEGFLIVSGECILLVEGQERHMKTWDYFHCPADTDHLLIASGEEPCVAIAVGSRASRDVVYPVSELAQKYGGSVENETADPEEAYEGLTVEDTAYKDGWLPDL
jgi:uncharacterized cupin superfamily protein